MLDRGAFTAENIPFEPDLGNASVGNGGLITRILKAMSRDRTDQG